MQLFEQQWPKVKAMEEEMRSSSAEVNKIENRHKQLDNLAASIQK